MIKKKNVDSEFVLSMHLANVNDKTEYIFPVLATLFNLFSTSIILNRVLPRIALNLLCNTVLVPFLHVEPLTIGRNLSNPNLASVREVPSSTHWITTSSQHHEQCIVHIT